MNKKIVLVMIVTLVICLLGTAESTAIVKRAYSVAVSATVEGDDIIVTNQGGSDSYALTELRVFVDGVDCKRMLNPIVGDTLTCYDLSPGDHRVIVFGKFVDGSEQPLLDTYLTVESTEEKKLAMLTVRVEDEDMNKLPGCKVEVIYDSNKKVGFTDEEGEVDFTIPPGKATIIVNCLGYTKAFDYYVTELHPNGAVITMPFKVTKEGSPGFELILAALAVLAGVRISIKQHK